MHAEVGDWLVVQSRSDDRHARRAEIIEVQSDQGAPPYTVRWLDDGREALIFPGPDAHVVTAAEQAELDAAQAERVARVQSSIAAEHHPL